MATAGRSVVFASGHRAHLAAGPRLGGLPVHATFGYATAIAVVSVSLAALTLVPALCGLAGTRLLPRRTRKGRARVQKTPLTARWARGVVKRPVAAAPLR